MEEQRLSEAAGVGLEDGMYLPKGWKPFLPYRYWTAGQFALCLISLPLDCSSIYLMTMIIMILLRIILTDG